MTNAILYTAPGTCGRVTAIALYEAGVPFEARLIRFKSGEHRGPEHLARNPFGKVPVLEIEGATLRENVAMLLYLAAAHPEANLLPTVTSPTERAAQIADLCFCSSTLHPIVTRMRIPTLFADGEAATASVHNYAIADMAKNLAIVEKRLEAEPWWYGQTWSVVDGYLFWVWFRVTVSGFDGAPYPRLTAHAARMLDRPAVKQAIELEGALEKQLADEGMSFSPSMMARR